MNSFIDLMANDIWSDQDVTTRTEAMVRSVMPLQDELVLNRKVQGAALGQYELTAQDQADMARLAQAGFEAQQMGIAARADMALLLQVLEVEAAIKRLDQPEDEAYEADQAERAEAMAVVSGASEEVLRWVEQRRPLVAEDAEVPQE
jgi:hypothetical protein